MRDFEHIPIGPFRDWVEKRVERYRRLEEEPGGDRRPDGYVNRTAEDLGVDVRTLHRWRFQVPEIPRATVEEALHRAGSYFWEVYPERDFPELYEEEKLKPSATLLAPELLLRARALYDCGMSMAEVARELFEASGYGTPASLTAVLFREFGRHGWPRRSAGESRGLYIGGDCAGWVGDRPCRVPPMRGERHCYAHVPGKRSLAEGGLAPEPLAAWIGRRAVELEANDRALGRRWGMNRTQVWKLRTGRKTGNEGAIGFVRRATVERILKADGTTTLAELYPEAA